jgi:hypothetical protein
MKIVLTKQQLGELIKEHFYDNYNLPRNMVVVFDHDNHMEFCVIYVRDENNEL